MMKLISQSFVSMSEGRRDVRILCAVSNRHNVAPNWQPRWKFGVPRSSQHPRAKLKSFCTEFHVNKTKIPLATSVSPFRSRGARVRSVGRLAKEAGRVVFSGDFVRWWDDSYFFAVESCVFDGFAEEEYFVASEHWGECVLVHEYEVRVRLACVHEVG
jgi:hypothetical protein